MMQYVVSACLAGVACRYDGKANLCEAVRTLVDEGRALPVCPEVLGGLCIPRVPCELQSALKGGYAPLQKRVVNALGYDQTSAFITGAQRALLQAQEAGCTVAIVKSRSPSCGAHAVYDGSFSKCLVPGQGIFAHMLVQAGFAVFSEEQLPFDL